LQNIQELIEVRDQARQQKDWQLADKIRNKLIKMGIEVADSVNGTIWFLQ
jgi:cysteinyl-tRNA synthetase